MTGGPPTRRLVGGIEARDVVPVGVVADGDAFADWEAVVRCDTEHEWGVDLDPAWTTRSMVYVFVGDGRFATATRTSATHVVVTWTWTTVE